MKRLWQMLGTANQPESGVMNKCLMKALIVALGLSVPAFGQFYPGRPAAPYGAFGGGLYGPYGPYGAFGGVFPYGLYSGAAVGPYGTAARYGTLAGPMASPVLPSPAISAVSTAASASPEQSADPNAGWTTGHPTRFFNYGRYFFNQGGAVATTPSSVLGPGSGVLQGVGILDPTRNRIGGQPARGRENIQRGK